MEDHKSELSRRGFISTTASCLAAAGLMAVPGTKVFAQEKTDVNKEQPILTRKIGKAGPEVPIVGMGVANASGPSIIKAAFEHGVRLFDTAATYQYGGNEQLLGTTLKKMGVRDQATIITKVFTPRQRRGLTAEQSKAKFIKATDASLSRLKMDHVEIMFVHDVGNPEEVNNEGVKEAATILKKQGKIGMIGVATHASMASVIDATVSAGFYDIVLTAINFTMADDTALLAAIANAHKKGLGVIAMKTQAGGSRWPNPDSRQAYDTLTINKACLKWVMRNENIASSIPGFNTFEHLEQDFSVAHGLEYAEQEEAFLSDNSITLGMGFCRQCQKCLASCPAGVEIPTLMRTHMYATQYANFSLARMALDEIPSQAGLKQCSSCDACTAQCANSVPIPDKIAELKLIYG